MPKEPKPKAAPKVALVPKGPKPKVALVPKARQPKVPRLSMVPRLALYQPRLASVPKLQAMPKRTLNRRIKMRLLNQGADDAEKWEEDLEWASQSS